MRIIYPLAFVNAFKAPATIAMGSALLYAYCLIILWLALCLTTKKNMRSLITGRTLAAFWSHVICIWVQPPPPSSITVHAHHNYVFIYHLPDHARAKYPLFHMFKLFWWANNSNICICLNTMSVEIPQNTQLLTSLVRIVLFCLLFIDFNHWWESCEWERSSVRVTGKTFNR